MIIALFDIVNSVWEIAACLHARTSALWPSLYRTGRLWPSLYRARKLWRGLYGTPQPLPSLYRTKISSWRSN